MEYEIRKNDGRLAGAGYTDQLFMDLNTQQPVLWDPDFWADFKQRWQAGEFTR